MSFLEYFRNYRTQKFAKIAKFLLKFGITANLITTISLLSGLVSIYYLFQNHLLFILFAVLHLIADALDGVIARHSTATTFGSYYDAITDSTINLLAILKIAYFTTEMYAYLIAVLFIIIHTIYFLSNMKLPILQSRTLTLLILTLSPLHPQIITIAYLLPGAFILYSAAKMIEQKSLSIKY